MAKNGQLIYQGFYRETPSGAIYLQQKDGCKLIAEVVPATATNQSQLNSDMEIIVKALNDSGANKALDSQNHHRHKSIRG